MDYLGGRECEQTWLKAKWNVSPGLKKFKIAKRKAESIEKTWKCEAEGRCAWGDFISRKTGKMHSQNSFTDDFFAVEPKQLERKRLAFGIL